MPARFPHLHFEVPPAAIEPAAEAPRVEESWPTSDIPAAVMAESAVDETTVAAETNGHVDLDDIDVAARLAEWGVVPAAEAAEPVVDEAEPEPAAAAEVAAVPELEGEPAFAVEPIA